MAKIMMFNIPAYGHVNVTLPVAYELNRRGHEVLYYCGDEMRDSIEKTGATYKRCPDALPSSRDISDNAGNLANISIMLMETCHEMIPFVIHEIEQQQPDVVVYDATNLWVRVATYMTHTPSIVTFSVMVSEGVEGLMDLRSLLYAGITALPKIPSLLRHRSHLIKQYGSEPLQFPLFPSKADLNLVFVSREYQMETPWVDETFRFVGASINPEMRTDAPLDLPDDMPLIYVSLGTVNNQNLGFYQGVLQAFDGYPARIILSIGKHISLADMQPIPANFTVMNSVPQLQVLQQADLFVTHGGMNSVQEALYYGVPMVTVPQQVEQAFNGKRVQALGAGKVIADKPPFGNVDVEELVEAVNDVLNQPHYKTNATKQSDFSRQGGGYKKAADEIELFLAN